MEKKLLSFYDVRTKKKFDSKDWVHKVRSGKNFAVAVNPKSKGECWRIIGADLIGKISKTKKK